ncbi:unnamed protein product [Rotaria socialis]|uniref:Uncharacterized protein n=2 Tax=Rotaria socialis TaxID=392032 RepID=A0A817XEI6_9BILA|nr:unnamed protein product [Rotaria socialis]
MWSVNIVLLMTLSLLDQVKSQACQGATQYDQCSSNIACGCLPLMNIDNSSICVLLHVKCSDLVSCAENSRVCYRPAHQCVRHPQCHSTPVCYPEAMALQVLCPPIPATTTPSSVVPDDGICENAIWNINGATVAGGNGEGSYTLDVQQQGLNISSDLGASSGRVVAGGHEEGNQTNQLTYVTKVIVDKNGTMFICDRDIMQVKRWFKDATHGEILIANISCWGLAIDNKETLYISDFEQHLVITWPGGQVVAGGNGEGHALNQLSEPNHIFVDQDQSVFVTDFHNNRVTKWPTGAKVGIVVAGESAIVDRMGTIYVNDHYNHRIMRWLKGSTSGSIIIGGQGSGNGTTQLSYPDDLIFDRQGNIYVSDYFNHRVQMFTVDKSTCVKVST